MASERAQVALYMRRGGARYYEIARELQISSCRARQLVSIVDGESLVTACLTERASEPA